VAPRNLELAAKLALAIFALSSLSSTGTAQLPSRGSELRADLIVAGRAVPEAGLSLVIPAGIYARTALTGAAGATKYPSGTAVVGRAELVTRFVLDPFRESPYGLSIGGGLGATNIEDGKRWRPYLAVVLDLELERTARLMPAVQLGLGGGARIGVVLRRSSERWR
jgi:hypothetical protein